jgi:hypothetical protein
MDWARSNEELKGEDHAVSGSITGENLGWSSGMTGGVCLSVREREKRLYQFGESRVGRGPFLLLGRRDAPGPFLYFFSFSTFSFLFSYFFYNFCKFGPICFKPICKIF